MSVTDAREGERDYVLGTHDEEIERLGLQHRVWRPHATAAWRRAGFTVGQTLIDLGSGPGYAAIDLAEIAGPSGRVIAIDRSRRFLDTLESRARVQGVSNLEAHEHDLDEGRLPVTDADGAWARWVFSFVRRPRDLVTRVHEALRPGATLALHEYVHYQTWRIAPRCREHEAFVQMVMESWRETGGEADIGMDLPRWLEEQGFEIRHIAPIVEVVRSTDFAWQWPMAFIGSGLRRLVTIGKVSRERAREMEQKILAACAEPHTFQVLPTVVEIVARRT
jgi:SAM-dependent methyltransferase